MTIFLEMSKTNGTREERPSSDGKKTGADVNDVRSGGSLSKRKWVKLIERR